MQCSFCGTQQEKTYRCVQCLSCYYCSKDCSVKDWQAGHKSQCKKLSLLNEEAWKKLRINKKPILAFRRRPRKTNIEPFLEKNVHKYDENLIEYVNGWELDNEESFNYGKLTKDQLPQLFNLSIDEKYYNTKTQSNSINILIHHDHFSCQVKNVIPQDLLQRFISIYLADTTEALVSNALDELFRSDLFENDKIYDICRTYIEQENDYEIKASLAGVLSRIYRVYPDDRKKIIDILSIVFDNDHLLKETPDTLGFFVCKLIEMKATETHDLVRRAFTINNVDVIYCGGYNAFCNKLDIKIDENDELVQRYKDFN
jgi:hypothetical protein